MSLGINAGDEVITQANSYIGSAAAINAVGAKPVFGDVYDDQTMDVEDMKSKLILEQKLLCLFI